MSLSMEDLARFLLNENEALENTVRRLTAALDVAIPYLRHWSRGEHSPQWDAEQLQEDLDTVKSAIEHGACVLGHVKHVCNKNTIDT